MNKLTNSWEKSSKNPEEKQGVRVLTAAEINSTPTVSNQNNDTNNRILEERNAAFQKISKLLSELSILQGKLQQKDEVLKEHITLVTEKKQNHHWYRNCFG